MPRRPVLVTDFDGTITRLDYYQLIRKHLTPPGTPDFWAEHLAGRLSHFDALKETYFAAEGGEPALLGLLPEMGLEPRLAEEVAALRHAGWHVVVVSAGCSWYIGHLLEGAGVDLEVHANPGRVVEGRLVLGRDRESPFYCEEVGVDKAAVVRDAMSRGGPVAFAGNGHPDLAPALLVPPRLRFARALLADELRERGDAFRPFERWAEVARALLEGSGPGREAEIRPRSDRA
jgi:HAD superfamily phosphoserine phosphatase-like hydrolase